MGTKVVILKDEADALAAEYGQILLLQGAKSNLSTHIAAGSGRSAARHVQQGGLPLPEVPMMAANSPCSMERLTSSSAFTKIGFTAVMLC